MREKPKETRHERGVRGYSAGIGRCSRGRCSSEQRLVATRGRWSDGVVCAEQRLYSFSWKLLLKNGRAEKFACVSTADPRGYKRTRSSQTIHPAPRRSAAPTLLARAA